MIDAVVLAGRRNEGELRSVSDAPWEALIEIAGTPMTAWVIRALREVPDIGRIVVVGPEELRAELGPDDAVAEPGDTMLENAARGAAGTREGSSILFVTGDVAMLTGEAVREFLSRAGTIDAEAHYPIVPKARVEAVFPGNRRTYVRMRDGVFTGGNLLLLAPGVWQRGIGEAQRLIALRKKPLRLAGMIGIGFVLRLVMGQAAIRHAEERFSKILGMRARAVVSSHPEVGVDIDHASDVPYGEQMLRLRQGGQG